MDFLKQPIDNLRDDLDFLNRDWTDLEGTSLTAIQCYHFETDPPHFLFNTNCPDRLKKRLMEILNKHFPADQTSI